MREAMVIAADMVPEITFVLTDESGTVLDRSNGLPRPYLHGYGNTPAPLERALEGLQVGDHVNVAVPPEHAYGPRVGKTLSVRKRDFPGEVPSVGQSFTAPRRDGGEVVFWVMRDTGAYLTVSPDHPLAGQTLNYSINVVGLRSATEEEIEHKHVHGPGLHQP